MANESLQNIKIMCIFNNRISSILCPHIFLLTKIKIVKVKGGETQKKIRSNKCIDAEFMGQIITKNKRWQYIY